jgi:class 3 adenylate cyclase
MARLGTTERAKLPDSAFAYVDARGHRRLPIHDAAHVRNALARFNQVAFDDEATRQRARKRLLNAAKRFGIVPVGFITAQLESERERGRDGTVPLPSGFVSMLLTDIEGSTGLVQFLGDRYGQLLDGVRRIQRSTAEHHGGYVVETRADEFFAVFEAPSAALATAVSIQRLVLAESWPEEVTVRVRVGVHSGYPTLSKNNYIGMAVHTAARICDAGHGGQIVTSLNTRIAIGKELPDGVRLRKLGVFDLRGLPEPVELYQVLAEGVERRFPPLRTAK